MLPHPFLSLTFCFLPSFVTAIPVDHFPHQSSPPTSPPVEGIISISRHLSIKPNTTMNLYVNDFRRAQVLRGDQVGDLDPKMQFVSTPAANQVVSYIAKIGVGNPPVQYSLIIDTGSSNTWIGANASYIPSSTSRQTPDSVSVRYGSGSFSGTQFIDAIDLGNGLVIPEQSIGVANTSAGFIGVDGILGIGPASITQGTLSPDFAATIPTVTDNLFSLGLIEGNSIGISFEPTTSIDGSAQVNGQMTWGGTDGGKHNGSITYIPITSTAPANRYWGIDQKISYGKDGKVVMSLNAGIVDTGTTLTLIASDAFSAYQNATGATLDPVTGLLTIDKAGYDQLESMFFTIGDTTFEFTPNAQIWPRALNGAIGGSTDNIYLVIGNLGQESGSGLDFINGQTWLERFYSVYDTGNARVGIAQTPFTFANTN